MCYCTVVDASLLLIKHMREAKTGRGEQEPEGRSDPTNKTMEGVPVCVCVCAERKNERRKEIISKIGNECQKKNRVRVLKKINFKKTTKHLIMITQSQAQQEFLD